MHLSIRIISGLHKGRRIRGPKNLPVRPTTDFAKEGLFNILSHQTGVKDLRVLDLYSGTGNIAYEFASRGALGIDCVDQHRGCIRFIEQTAREFNFPITTHAIEVMRFVQSSKTSYDLVFADPPYDFNQETLELLVNQIISGSLLNQNGQLILEHTKERNFESHPNWVHSRKFGGSVFSFFE